MKWYNKHKTNELTGAALDWAVHIAQGLGDEIYGPYSTSWQEGGPIIDREITLMALNKPDCQATIIQGANAWTAFGPTPLIAAMRCFVASRLGDTINIPEELRGE
jgi:hypothetical protein